MEILCFFVFLNEFIMNNTFFFSNFATKIKKMILSLIYFLPCVVSMLWFLSFLLRQKSYRGKVFCYGEGASVVYYAIFGIYMFPNIDYDTMVRMETVSIPFGLLFPAFLVAYLYMHCYDRKLNEKILFLLCVPAIVFAVAINMLCSIIGFDTAAEVSRCFVHNTMTGEMDTYINNLYIFFTYYGFMMFCVLFMAILFALSCAILYRKGYNFGDVFRFFFCGKATYNSRMIATMFITQLLLLSLQIIIGTQYFTNHVVPGLFFMIALATVQHFVGYVEFYSQDNTLVTLYSLSHLSIINHQKNSVTETNDADNAHSIEKKDVESKEKEDFIEETDALPAASSAADLPSQSMSAAANIKMNKRKELLQELMEEKKIWKDEELTAQSVCDMMDIGKTTLSALVSQYYGTTFRDMVNKYRIEEAMRYMKMNPKATQEAIAMHCGFKNAQYFNTMFKKTVGETPSMWLAGISTQVPADLWKEIARN